MDTRGSVHVWEKHHIQMMVPALLYNMRTYVFDNFGFANNIGHLPIIVTKRVALCSTISRLCSVSVAKYAIRALDVCAGHDAILYIYIYIYLCIISIYVFVLVSLSRSLPHFSCSLDICTCVSLTRVICHNSLLCLYTAACVYHSPSLHRTLFLRHVVCHSFASVEGVGAYRIPTFVLTPSCTLALTLCSRALYRTIPRQTYTRGGTRARAR